MRSACSEHFYKEYKGKRYCVLHFPSNDKREDFNKALRQKLDRREFDFTGVWFCDEVAFKEFEFSSAADFSFATFNKRANFSFAKFSSSVTFQGAKFGQEANFSSATFHGDANFAFTTFAAECSFTAAALKNAFFLGTKFFAPVHFYVVKFLAKTYFVSAQFRSTANFTDCQFSDDANFKRAAFGEAAYFWDVRFNGKAIFREVEFLKDAYFQESIFSDYVEFTGTGEKDAFGEAASLDLAFARFEKPDRVLFHTLSLHPCWFINIDARRFEFINIHWHNSGKAKPELILLSKSHVESRFRLLAIGCRRLAANAEENDRYREASHFRRMALEAERLETWGGFDVRKLNWWYWFASGYGERPFQALVVLIGVLVLFGLFYNEFGFARWEPRIASESDAVVARRDDLGAPLKLSRALTYSAAVMTLQRPEPKPATTAAQAMVLLETILGPVQGALLALAIRRKFMR